MGRVKLHPMLARELIFRFDVSMESRQLSELERQLRAKLKHAYQGLASMECTMARQRPKIS